MPTAAVVLIGLGVLFLLQTAGVFEFNVGRIWPMFLIFLGVWMFANRTGMLRHGYDPHVCYSRRIWSGPIWLVTIGTLFLIQSFDGPGFGRTWPVLLLVVGLMKLMDTRTPPPPIPAGPPPTTGFTGGSVPPPENYPREDRCAGKSAVFLHHSEVKNG